MKKKTPASPKLLVEITEDLIKSAKKRDSSHCMIAEAVKAAYPEAAYVSVDLQTIRFTDPNRRLRYTYLTPRVAQIGLIHFDQGLENIAPFDFRLRGGQVTRSGKKASEAAPPRELSEAELQQRKNAFSRSTLSKARLVDRKKGQTVAERVGGKTPPSTPFARRRAFGLRMLQG